MIVLDASAVVELVVGTATGERVGKRIAGPDDSLHAPHLLSIEVTQVVRRLVSTGDLGADRAEAALRDLTDLDVVRYDHEVLVERIWQLRANLTAYDAAYIALAEALDAPLLTLDRRLAATPGHSAVIEHP